MNIPPPSIVEASPVTLPEELIGEVLSLLTVKSLMRLKCVNKSWNTLISDPIFVKMHLKLSPRNTHLVLRCSNRDNYSSGFISANIIPISVSDLLKSWENTVTLTDDPYRRFHSKDLRSIIGSCNGLICLLDGNYMNSDFEEHSLYFWNPATRTKSEKLGYIRSNRYTSIDVKFAFGYDNSTDTYKVVMLEWSENPVIRTAVKVFTLGENVWRDIDCFPVVLVCCHPNFLDSHDGVYFSNSIDWLVHHEYNCHLKNLTIKEYCIVSFDLGTETYSQLLLPPCSNEYLLHTTSSTSAALFVFMDCLSFSYDFEKTYFVIWQMKEFGVEESWTQFLKISYLDLNISINISDLEYGMRLIPLCFSDDDALIFITNFGDKPFLYDWRNNRVKIIKSIKFGDETIRDDWRNNRVKKIKSIKFGDETIRDDWYNAKGYYVESLVSTC